jgi:hypothetical protein
MKLNFQLTQHWKMKLEEKINKKNPKTNNLRQSRLTCQTCNPGYVIETTYRKQIIIIMKLNFQSIQC